MRIGKSVLVAILISVFCFVLTGCDSNKYEKANALFLQEEYQEALKLYQELGEYEDSIDKAKVCEKEIGMRTHADYDFLKELEQSILERMETTSKESFDRSSVVNIELSHLEEFKNKEFYDSKLKKIAKKYINGLKIQKDSLNKELKSEYQIEWQRGLVYRYAALVEAYDKYDFLKENEKFIGTYISQFEDQKKLLDAYDAIEKDIGEQTGREDFLFNFDDNQIYFTIKNNTNYTYSTVFEFFFYDQNSVQFDSTKAYIENIKPNTSYVVSVYISNPDKLDELTWNNYYSEVKY